MMTVLSPRKKKTAAVYGLRLDVMHLMRSMLVSWFRRYNLSSCP